MRSLELRAYREPGCSGGGDGGDGDDGGGGGGGGEGGGGGGGEGGEAVHECAARLLGDSLRHECGPSNREPAAGAIALRVASGPGPADVELLWAHNTPSFAVGYYHHGLDQPCAFVSRTQTSGKGQPLVSGTYVACL